MNSRKVLLFNDNSKRDLLGIRLLEHALHRRGIKTLICNPFTAKSSLRNFRPHAFIASRSDHAISREASNLCRVYILPGEGGQQTKETMLSVFMGRGYWKLDSVEWISRCFLWSQRTHDWLMDTGLFNEHQLAVVGSPRLDLYRDQKLIKDFSNTNKGFRLGVAFSAKSTSTYYGNPEYAKVYFNMHSEMNFPITQPGRGFEDLIWRDHAILRTMMRSLRAYLENSSGEVWLRPSPYEDPREYIFLEKNYPGRIKIQSHQTLPEFLAGVDSLLTCWSTVGLEALLIDKPVISIAALIDPDHLFRHISPEASGFNTFAQFYHQPSTEAALLETLNQASQKTLPVSPKTAEAVSDLLKQLYSWPSKTSVCDLIANEIERDILSAPEIPPSTWKAKMPFKLELPLILISLLVRLKMALVVLRSGNARAYWGFLRSYDPAVEKLVHRKLFNSLQN